MEVAEALSIPWHGLGVARQQPYDSVGPCRMLTLLIHHYHSSTHWLKSFSYFLTTVVFSAQSLNRLQDSVAMQRAEEVLNSLAEGETVRADRVEWALQTVYECDPTFRENCNLLIPEAAELHAERKRAAQEALAAGTAPNKHPVGRLLAQHLKELGLGQLQEGWVE